MNGAVTPQAIYISAFLVLVRTLDTLVPRHPLSKSGILWTDWCFLMNHFAVSRRLDYDSLRRCHPSYNGVARVV